VGTTLNTQRTVQRSLLLIDHSSRTNATNCDKATASPIEFVEGVHLIDIDTTRAIYISEIDYRVDKNCLERKPKKANAFVRFYQIVSLIY